MTLVAAVGLFKSFDGTIFGESYSGASVVWLGYGAWSVTFLLAMGLFLGDFLSRRFPTTLKIFIATVAFIPFLLCGSRIDFFSGMLALAAYTYVFDGEKFNVRVSKALVILVYAVMIAYWVGSVRYTSEVPSLIPFSMVNDSMGNKMVFLSTIGDVGVSLFQIIGLTKGGDFPIGITEAINVYLMRLLPGPFFAERPHDLMLQLPEAIGGGALHSLGEAYLVSGFLGCALMGAIFGMLIAISIFSGRYLMFSRSPILWTIFLFPWLLLIRGGWYQFFAILKSIEILLILVLAWVVISWIRNRFFKMYAGRRAS